MQAQALLSACTELLAHILTFSEPADAAVSRYLRTHRHLGARDRAVLAETVYAVLRRKLLLDFQARSGSGAHSRRLAILGWAGAPATLSQALSAHEQAWLAAIRQTHPRDLLPQHHHNLPAWLAEQLQAQLGEQFQPLAESLLHNAPLDVRVNTTTAKRAAVQQALRQHGVDSDTTPYSPWGLRLHGKPALARLEAFRNGHIEVQDEGSQLLALLVDAHRGEMVTDFCAGAGGKTLAMGAAMRNTGRLYALDVSQHRLDKLKPRLARSGLSNVHPIAIAHERDDRVKRLTGKMDRVLVDAPCSGTGTLRRNPDLKWRQTPQAVEELTHKQAAILESAARMVKTGGRLVYATCSILPQENAHIAQAFSATHPDFEPLPCANLLAALHVPHADSLCSDQGQYLRLWPHLHQTDGFFAAVWQRR